jgi:hypothetical protein
MGRASAMYDAMLDGLVLSRGWGGQCGAEACLD